MNLDLDLNLEVDPDLDLESDEGKERRVVEKGLRGVAWSAVQKFSQANPNH